MAQAWLKKKHSHKINTIAILINLNLLCILFKIKAWLPGPIMLYQSCCPPTVVTAHQVGTNLIVWSPGDMLSSPNIQSEPLLPGSGDWAPLQALFPGVTSAAQEARVICGVVISVFRQLGQ